MNKIINSKLVRLDINGTNKKEIIVELAKLIEQEGRLNSIDEYVEEVLKREELSTTGIGFGVAIPHGKTNAVKVPTVAFGRSKNGVEWQSLDDNPVHMIFLLAVPEEEASNAHLKLLAALSRKLMDESFRQELLTIDSEEKLIELLETIFTN
ncbi:hypothetical protein TR13x_09575 [Caloranaerobacter sp. TR13]|uniref:PTS sugar transporter subunit IIA n=1 Tax=Caloranaerobacter sp. TR13 TaxID=1302151 RepID=UPI0006D41E2B|nr:fructose PTS transporter subunit IIA [Caloranaerobacter sp. TR13]KPU26584.1 hypothetical protein TR13x_09575 [Caloranaerobacter sp. TR13]